MSLQGDLFETHTAVKWKLAYVIASSFFDGIANGLYTAGAPRAAFGVGILALAFLINSRESIIITGYKPSFSKIRDDFLSLETGFFSLRDAKLRAIDEPIKGSYFTDKNYHRTLLAQTGSISNEAFLKKNLSADYDNLSSETILLACNRERKIYVSVLHLVQKMIK